MHLVRPRRSDSPKARRGLPNGVSPLSVSCCQVAENDARPHAAPDFPRVVALRLGIAHCLVNRHYVEFRVSDRAGEPFFLGLATRFPS